MDFTILWPKVKRLEESQASGGSGYVETKKKTLTWNGDTTDLGAENIFGAPVVRLTEEVLDLNDITGITATLHEVVGGTEKYLSRDSFGDVSIGKEYHNIQLADFSGTNISIIFASVPAGLGDEVYFEMGLPGAGVYLAVTDDLYFVSSVHFEIKTIHPIDPKFIPGAVLPVVELSTTVTSGATFTDAENAALTNAFESGLPVVFKGNFELDGVSFSNVATVGQSATLVTTNAFVVYQGTNTYTFIQQNDGTWRVN